MDTQNVNPYTKAIWNCLQQFPDSDEPPEMDEATGHFLANMIQGRFTQYLANRMCEFYQITEPELEKKLIMVLMNILSDKFFNVFREKVKARKEIVYLIARKIAKSEIKSTYSTLKKDALYRWISKKYFQYRNFRIILQWVNTNPEVEKIVFLSHIQKRIKDSTLIKALHYILQNDKDGIAPDVFNRYLSKGKIDRLNSLVKTGDWKLEAGFVMEQSAKMISWRNYMNSL